MTIRGETKPIKWIGRQLFTQGESARWPDCVHSIRIIRSALADNVPHADLYLSPAHALFIDGVLIEVKRSCQWALRLVGIEPFQKILLAAPGTLPFGDDHRSVGVLDTVIGMILAVGPKRQVTLDNVRLRSLRGERGEGVCTESSKQPDAHKVFAGREARSAVCSRD